MWKVRNTGHETLLFQIGAHPAFYYPGFKAEEAMKGYFGFDRKEDLSIFWWQKRVVPIRTPVIR